MKLRDKPLIHDLYDRVNVYLSFDKSLIKEVQDTFSLEGDTDYEFKIKAKSKKRSLDANAYAWLLIGKLAQYYKLTKDEVYRKQIENMGTYKVMCVKREDADGVCKLWEQNGLGWICELFPSKIQGCVNVKAHYGSSVFDTKEMSTFIDNIIHECHIAHIPVSEEEIALAMEHWE